MSSFDFSVFPVLETERLVLRQIGPADAETWQNIFNNPEVMHYLTDFVEPTATRSEIDSIIQWTANIFEQKKGIRWGITLKPDDKLIGSCGFHLYRPVHRCAELGYELQHEHWGVGIMTEALTAVLQFCFEPMGMHRVEANVTVGNHPSGGLLRRLGFRLEGTARQKVFARGRFHDLWDFSLLEDEYQIR